MRSAALTLILVSLAGCADPKGQTATGASLASATPSASVPVEDAGSSDAGSSDAGPRDASPDASGAAMPTPPPPAPPPSTRALEVPDETKSPLPKVPEWTDTVRRDVVVRPEYACTLQRVREWNRITCNASNATVTLVTGTRDGVSLWANRDTAQMLFPVRRGDRRVIELLPHPKLVTAEGAYGPSQFEEPGGGPAVLSETWLEGEDAPTLVVQ